MDSLAYDSVVLLLTRTWIFGFHTRRGIFMVISATISCFHSYESCAGDLEEPWHSCSKLRGQPSLKARRLGSARTTGSPQLGRLSALGDARRFCGADSQPCANTIVTEHIGVAQHKKAQKLRINYRGRQGIETCKFFTKRIIEPNNYNVNPHNFWRFCYPTT
jgi:hypothetical protein